jgi:hypothetical protein
LEVNNEPELTPAKVELLDLIAAGIANTILKGAAGQPSQEDVQEKKIASK